MTHIMPTFKKTYPLFLLFILFCVNNVHSSPNLHQEVVFVNANSASLSELQKDDTAVIIDYTVESSALQQVDKTPVPGDNVKGILFTVNDPCSVITDATSIPSKIPSKLKSNQMIAVIARSSNCTDQKQLLNAQTFGAIGAIIYDVSAPSSSVVIDSSNTITIPTYKINTSSGKQLSDDVRAYANETPSDKGSRIILITMDSSTPNSFGSGWQIAIIVIGSVLAVSFLISVLIHCRLYHLRRHERNAMMAQHEANAISKLEKFKLEESVVKSFPTVVYSKQLHVKKSGSKTESSPTTSSPPSSPGDVRRLSLLTEDGSSNDICPICLEEFVEGETLRQLPSCSHLYHIDCVDKWLTTKSSECPLCKKDSTPPEVAQKREKRFVKTIEVHSRLDNIYDTSNNRSRRDSTTTNGRSPSRLSTFLGFFGYGATNEYNDSQSRIHPSGSSLFAIQEIPSVAYRSSRSENRFDNLNRIV